MSENEKTLNTVISDYKRLYNNVLMIKGLFKPLEEELIGYAPNTMQQSIIAFSDLLEMVSEDMENSYIVNECEVM